MFETPPTLQVSLFGSGPVSFDREFSNLERIDLDAQAWLDYAPLWLDGEADLFSSLVEKAEWAQPVVKMYEREVVTPRLVARVDPTVHPVIPSIIDALSDKYERRLDQVSAGWYRDGNDSVAFHGDRVARDRDEAVVATVSLGGPRRFLIRPRAGGASVAFSLGHGDLVVMGGSCQRTWEHSVPKAKSTADPRIALMFRHTYE